MIDMTVKGEKCGNRRVSTSIPISQFTNEKILYFYNFKLWIIMTLSLPLHLLINSHIIYTRRLWENITKTVTLKMQVIHSKS